MKYKVNLQIASQSSDLPNRFIIYRWISKVLKPRYDSAELCLRIVDQDESKQLNIQYRQKNFPTNVLAFPAEIPNEVKLDKPFLGDIVICAPIVAAEALEQGKTEMAHWAHLIIHGLLHLLGYDHITDAEAAVMESIEIETLAQLGFPNPYIETNNQSQSS